MIESQNRANGPTIEDLRKRFLKASYQLQKIGALAGYRIFTTTNSELPLFTTLPEAAQRHIVNVIEQSCLIHQTVLGEGKDLKNASAVAWSALKYFGMIPPSDFFDKFESDDVIQIYSIDNLHLFANFRFFELCSYTLEQVYSMPWASLWERDANSLEMMHRTLQATMAPDNNDVVMLNEPAHRVRELASPFKFEIDYTIKCCAPLKSKISHQRAGYIVLERGRVLNLPNPLDEETMLEEFYSGAPNEATAKKPNPFRVL